MAVPLSWRIEEAGYFPRCIQFSRSEVKWGEAKWHAVENVRNVPLPLKTRRQAQRNTAELLHHHYHLPSFVSISTLLCAILCFLRRSTWQTFLPPWPPLQTMSSLAKVPLHYPSPPCALPIPFSAAAPFLFCSEWDDVISALVLVPLHGSCSFSLLCIALYRDVDGLIVLLVRECFLQFNVQRQWHTSPTSRWL